MFHAGRGAAKGEARVCYGPKISARTLRSVARFSSGEAAELAHDEAALEGGEGGLEDGGPEEPGLLPLREAAGQAIRPPLPTREPEAPGELASVPPLLATIRHRLDHRSQERVDRVRRAEH